MVSLEFDLPNISWDRRTWVLLAMVIAVFQTLATFSYCFLPTETPQMKTDATELEYVTILQLEAYVSEDGTSRTEYNALGVFTVFSMFCAFVNFAYSIYGKMHKMLIWAYLVHFFLAVITFGIEAMMIRDFDGEWLTMSEAFYIALLIFLPYVVTVLYLKIPAIEESLSYDDDTFNKFYFAVSSVGFFLSLVTLFLPFLGDGTTLFNQKQIESRENHINTIIGFWACVIFIFWVITMINLWGMNGRNKKLLKDIVEPILVMFTVAFAVVAIGMSYRQFVNDSVESAGPGIFAAWFVMIMAIFTVMVHIIFSGDKTGWKCDAKCFHWKVVNTDE